MQSTFQIVITKQKNFDKQTPTEFLFGFSFNPEPVKSEIATVGSVILEFSPYIETGALDPDTNIPKMIEKMKAADLDNILAEEQRQIDIWRTANNK